MAKAQTYWISGTDTDWNTAENWNNGVPSIVNDAYMTTNAGTYTVSAVSAGTCSNWFWNTTNGTYFLNFDSTVVSNHNLYVSNVAGSSNTLYLLAGTITNMSAGSIFNFGSSGTGAYGALVVSNGCVAAPTVYFGVASGAAGRGYLNLVKGTVSGSTTLRCSQLSPAIWDQEGGLLSGPIVVGAGSVGFWNQTGGIGAGSLTLGNTVGGKGTLLQTGYSTNSFTSITISANASAIGSNIIAGANCVMTNTGLMKIGSSGPGVLILSNGLIVCTSAATWQQGLSGAASPSIYNQYGGILDNADGAMTLAVNSSGNAQFNVYGGVVTNKSISGGNSGSQSFINFYQEGGRFVTTGTVTVAQSNCRSLWSVQGGTNETWSTFSSSSTTDGKSIFDIGPSGYMYVTNASGDCRFVVGRTGTGYLTNAGMLVANQFLFTNAGAVYNTGQMVLTDSSIAKGGIQIAGGGVKIQKGLQVQ